ncbi:hypothetical protein CERZMDRAFT_101748 [Cercospora zeae-maydis SCOH1-5]|uniref:Uncharacterized protein n=1 Tax=Cercospora zeae-maydis SCOH1-5 TaxID=717836 RepID=A0A6A6F644_9PEZI|nr:hypothetical protein CERZMDRAFT_101748 [Cercospora zeae-maydis SCOH1-5]
MGDFRFSSSSLISAITTQPPTKPQTHNHNEEDPWPQLNNYSFPDSFLRSHTATAASWRLMDESSARMREFEEEWRRQEAAEAAAAPVTGTDARTRTRDGFEAVWSGEHGDGFVGFWDQSPGVEQAELHWRVAFGLEDAMEI